jgi:3-hydroxybutyryl-CoA dehydratase
VKGENTVPETFTPRGRYFEEFQVGLSVASAGRTIAETDVVSFAGLSGDYNQIHTDAEFARQGMFGQRVAHGLLGLAVASGLVAQMGFIEGTVLAFRELTWKFSLPIFIGDTIHVETTVAELKPMRRLGGGAVILDVRIVNQEDKVVQRGKWVALIASKPE